MGLVMIMMRRVKLSVDGEIVASLRSGKRQLPPRRLFLRAGRVGAFRTTSTEELPLMVA